MVYKLINHFGCWKNTRRIRKSLAYGSRFKSSSRNISKTSASVSSGFPNTRKLMKARGHRPSAFIVFECLETPMKHEARVFEIASQTSRVVYSAQKPKNTCGLLLKYPKNNIHIKIYLSVSVSWSLQAFVFVCSCLTFFWKSSPSPWIRKFIKPFRSQFPYSSVNNRSLEFLAYKKLAKFPLANVAEHNYRTLLTEPK